MSNLKRLNKKRVPVTSSKLTHSDSWTSTATCFLILIGEYYSVSGAPKNSFVSQLSQVITTDETTQESWNVLIANLYVMIWT